MTKKVYVEAILISEEDGQNSLVKFDGNGVVRRVDTDKVYTRSEPVKLPLAVLKWYRELIKEHPLDGNDMFRIIKGILAYEEYEGTGLEGDHWSIADYNITKEIYNWVKNHEKELFTLLVTGNYVIEDEPKYEVELPNTSNGNLFFLKRSRGKVRISNISDLYIEDTSSGRGSEYWKENYLLTEKEIKEDFGWAWQFAKRVGDNNE